MSKQCLDVQQIQHLQEMGLNTSNASMVWCKYDGEKEYSHLLPKDEDVFERCLAIKYIPAYTLQDVLDALPCAIGWKDLILEKTAFGWKVMYRECDCIPAIEYENRELIDAAYELLCWCIENKFVETNKNE